MTLQPKTIDARLALTLACMVVIATYVMMIDLKGISTDEGIRLAIINGGRPFTLDTPATPPTWAMVLDTGNPYAYQPLYYLMQNTLMRVAQTHDVLFFRLVNIFFLWVSLQGLIALSQGWRLVSRLFLIGIFSFNAYLFMHVLQIREYIVGVAFYVWSTWLVLRLDTRSLGRAWADVAWFAAYGVLLSAGFYLQSWVVFPAIGQFLFLTFRRRAAPLRYLSHLALSYIIVLIATWPYLESHRQRADVGRWGQEGTRLWPQLSDGFHLVLSGHMTGRDGFTEFLFWFWPAVIAGATALLFSRKFDLVATVVPEEFKRRGLLMALCIGISLAFQVGYFFKVENLSVWPRYFVIHYFFVTFLTALGFKYLDDLRCAGTGSNWTRRGLTTAVGTIAVVAVASAIFQTHSYHQDPTFDTGFSRSSNWRTLCAELSSVIKPGDMVIAHDFVIRSTLSFTRPIPNPFIVLPELETTATTAVNRLVYLESVSVMAQRPDLAARMSSLGFTHMEEIRIPASDGKNVLPDWRVLAFSH
ncbi:hypothetical protein [Opitutus sp. GAS368]|uniref:hypothetical protein n=1 Tax=Opitutus sp. GAS368 TaxID=1882749 RepID=UPI0012FE32AB|nr:hypothetical protein [Opitutus sp. GAS368]